MGAGAAGLQSVYQTLDPVAQVERMEVDQETCRVTGKPEV
jgi:hypothetical protein